MDLKDFIAIRGKGDLYRIISRSPKGIIVEALNDTRIKFKVQPNLQVLVLYDITIFSKDNSDLYLKDVFQKIYEKDGLNISIDLKAEGEEIRKYFLEIAPSHDDEKVYISDIKKIIKWYSIISKWFPDVVENIAKEEKPEEEAEKTEEAAPDQKEEMTPEIETGTANINKDENVPENKNVKPGKTKSKPPKTFAF